jgi:hypothetical protein
MRSPPHKMTRVVAAVVAITYTFFGLPGVEAWGISTPFAVERAYAIITASSTTYATAGTFSYKVSTNACQVDVALWGAGGAGFDGTNSGGGAGGGGGAFASSTLTNLTIGNFYTIVVGAGGQTSGANGANSTFDTTVVIADGGNGGTDVITGEGIAGLAANSTGITERDGGQGGSGNNGDDGGGGGGGAAGPHNTGGAGGDASATVGGGGGAGNGGAGGNAGVAPNPGTSTTGGAGGTGDSNGATTPNGVAGTANVNGGGGGGGGDQASSGGAGGAPGGGGAGGETTVAPSATPFGVGARGQAVITEFINSAGCTSPPTVTTSAASGVTPLSGTLNGNISSTGGATVTNRGFDWGTNSSLSGGDTTTTFESGSHGTGDFSKNVSGLLAGVTYYFRAYAANSAGTTTASNTGSGCTTGICSFTAGTDTTPNRILRLFNGFRINVYGTLKIR